MNVDLLVHSIGELATANGDGPAFGEAMQAVTRTKDAAVAVADGRIVAVGATDEVQAKVKVDSKTRQIDASGKLVTAGLVDPHTHLVFGGNRSNEFIMRCQGKSYQEIAAAGGGIVASMSATRGAHADDLVATGMKRLDRMLKAGTTTCEVKTGYGLDLDSEIKLLQVILRLSELQPVEIVPTFMPAHAFPPGCNRPAYVQSVIDEMLPAAAAVMKKSNKPDMCLHNDVFCDEGYFTLADTKAILTAGRSLGLKPKVHADEFANLGATTLAVELGASSADHLLNTSDQEMKLLSASQTIAVLLPGTSFFLNLSEHARARKMIESGVAVALGSDYNPGSCHIFSLPVIFGLACLHLKLTVEEALTALTRNSACSLGLGDRIGQVRVGYQADLVVYDVASLEEIPYNIGWNPVATTIKHGKVVSTSLPAAVAH